METKIIKKYVKSGEVVDFTGGDITKNPGLNLQMIYVVSSIPPQYCKVDLDVINVVVDSHNIVQSEITSRDLPEMKHKYKKYRLDVFDKYFGNMKQNHNDKDRYCFPVCHNKIAVTVYDTDRDIIDDCTVIMEFSDYRVPDINEGFFYVKTGNYPNKEYILSYDNGMLSRPFGGGYIEKNYIEKYKREMYHPKILEGDTVTEIKDKLVYRIECNVHMTIYIGDIEYKINEQNPLIIKDMREDEKFDILSIAANSPRENKQYSILNNIDWWLTGNPVDDFTFRIYYKNAQLDGKEFTPLEDGGVFCYNYKYLK